MKEGISITTIFQIVIIFILLFTGIMALTINNTSAFSIKDKIINAIEENNGKISLDGEESLAPSIIAPIQEASYRITGKCPVDSEENSFIGYDRNGDVVDPDSKAAVCIRRVNVSDKIDRIYDEKYNTGESDTVLIRKQYFGYYYQVVMFYQLQLPLVRSIYYLQSKGDTKIFFDQIVSDKKYLVGG